MIVAASRSTAVVDKPLPMHALPPLQLVKLMETVVALIEFVEPVAILPPAVARTVSVSPKFSHPEEILLTAIPVTVLAGGPIAVSVHEDSAHCGTLVEPAPRCRAVEVSWFAEAPTPDARLRARSRPPTDRGRFPPRTLIVSPTYLAVVGVHSDVAA